MNLKRLRCRLFLFMSLLINYLGRTILNVIFCRNRDKVSNYLFLHLDLTTLENGRSQTDFLISHYFKVAK
jgi:hypothetical protein